MGQCVKSRNVIFGTSIIIIAIITMLHNTTNQSKELVSTRQPRRKRRGKKICTSNLNSLSLEYFGYKDFNKKYFVSGQWQLARQWWRSGKNIFKNIPFTIYIKAFIFIWKISCDNIHDEVTLKYEIFAVLLFINFHKFAMSMFWFMIVFCGRTNDWSSLSPQPEKHLLHYVLSLQCFSTFHFLIFCKFSNKSLLLMK